eukprot:c20383_g1_i2 orf=256-447(+)
MGKCAWIWQHQRRSKASPYCEKHFRAARCLQGLWALITMKISQVGCFKQKCLIIILRLFVSFL